ncbi:C-terminal domain of homeodomain 1-domain-containing protein [Mycena latifolia]|nr:C-terminal domain of homeodomain 1-domain-containing protein [Mycena latifolia]
MGILELLAAIAPFAMSSLSIHQRLLGIENEFLNVMSHQNLNDVAAFAQKWAQLDANVKTALQLNQLQEETISLAHNVASKIAIFADSFLSIEIESDNLAHSLVNQLETAFEDMNIVVPVADSTPTPQDSLPPPVAVRPDASHLPSYIEPAYRWLLKHLHNPYPSKEVKQRFADETGTSIERVSDWFVDARRRMGWTRLLREEFYRKRSALVDAARRYYKIDGGPPLPDIIIGRFVQIDSFAQEMYAAKLEPSPLSLKLTTAIKDLTPELQEKAQEQRRQQKLQAQRDAASAAAYPSPASSGASSPISDPGASTSRKRSSSDVSGYECSFSKRSRTDDGPSSDAFTIPSPPDSRHTSPSSSSRKRRLSDADAPGAKRPRNRAASDPIPITVTLSGTPDLLVDWFSSDKEGDTDIFNPGQLLDIKFFDPADYDIPDELAASPAEPVLQGDADAASTNTRASGDAHLRHPVRNTKFVQFFRLGVFNRLLSAVSTFVRVFRRRPVHWPWPSCIRTSDVLGAIQ